MINSYDELKPHLAHTIECVGYGQEFIDHGDGTESVEFENVALECIDCGMVLVDYDREGDDNGN